MLFKKKKKKSDWIKFPIKCNILYCLVVAVLFMLALSCWYLQCFSLNPWHWWTPRAPHPGSPRSLSVNRRIKRLHHQTVPFCWQRSRNVMRLREHGHKGKNVQNESKQGQQWDWPKRLSNWQLNSSMIAMTYEVWIKLKVKHFVGCVSFGSGH